MIAQDGTPEEGSLHREVRVRFSWPGLDPQVLSLKLLPGLPRILRLVPGHPFVSPPPPSSMIATTVVLNR